MKTGFCKDTYCDASRIKIPVDSIGLNRGYAAFDFMKVVKSQPFYTERHLDRFFRTMSLLRIEIPFSREEVNSIIQELAQKNTDNYYGLKFFAVPVETAGSEYFPSDLYITPVKIPVHPDEIFTQGISLMTKEYARFLPEAKSTNYMPSILWGNELKKYHAFEILYCFNQQVLETSRSNIFIVSKNHVYTPGTNVLKGITRSIVIDLLHEKQIPFTEKQVSTSELFAADEVFITGTTKEIMPVVKIDGKTIGNGKVGPVSTPLIEAYQKLIR
jgi:branched-subunit amino acid aminotransferase/4-amino-4-deoxychorismate lyase